MRKRLLSVLLTAALLLTMLPCGVSAADVQTGDTYLGPEDIWYDEDPVEMTLEEFLAQQADGQSAAADTTASYSTDYPNTHVNTGNQAYDVCCAAVTQIGYTETYDNHTKYCAWFYGSDVSVSWCAIFVSWCLGQGNAAGTAANKNALASGYSTGNMSSNPYGCPAYAFGTTPKMGDIAFIGSGGTSNHVGLVIGTSASYVWCVEGNASDSVGLRRYSLSSGYATYDGGSTGSTKIIFYARPNYSGSGIATPGITIDDNGNITTGDSKTVPTPDEDEDTDPTPSYDFCKFTDVPGDVYFSEPVLWASDNGYAKGMTDTTFEPYTECTRAQIITFLYRMAGSPAQTYWDYYSVYYQIMDVAYGTWYCDAIVWAVKEGIANGMTQYYFEPNTPCTRAQAVTFLWRLVGKPSYSWYTVNEFDDVTSDDYYYDAVLWGAEQGIVKGIDENSFGPSSTCTRAQIVTFMYRTYLIYGNDF